MAKTIWDRTPEDEAEAYLQQLIELWEMPLSAAFDAHGGVLPISKMPRELQLSIESFEVIEDPERGRRTRVKFISRAKLLQLIGHHVKINAYGTRQRAEAESSLADLMRAKARGERDGHHDREAGSGSEGDPSRG